MGALSFLKQLFGGNHQRSLNSVQGGTGAVNPPTFVQKQVAELDKLEQHYSVPNYCRESLRLMSRKKGASVAEMAESTGKKKGTIYQEMTGIRKSGVKISKKYEKPTYRYRVG
jgi:hypothetical protein